MGNTEIIIYQTEDGQTKIDVRMENETVWLSLDQLASLFQRDKSTISLLMTYLNTSTSICYQIWQIITTMLHQNYQLNAGYF